MADVNYVSPSSLMPQLGPVQIPGLAGFMLGNQERDYRDTMDLQKVLSGIGAQKAQIGLEEMVRDLPMKQAQRVRDTQDAELTTRYAPEFKELLAKDKRRTDSFDEAVLPSKTSAQISDNDFKVLQNKEKTYDAGMQHLLGLRGILDKTDDPTVMATFMEEAQKLGMKPDSPLFKHFSSAQNPDTLRERLDNFEKHYRTRKDENWRLLEQAKMQAEEKKRQTEMLEAYRRAQLEGNERRWDLDRDMRLRIAEMQNRAKLEVASLAKTNLPKTYEAEAIARQRAGDTEGAEMFRKLAVQVKQGRDIPSLAFIMSQAELGKLPKEQRTPEKQMELLSQFTNQLNGAVEMRAQQGLRTMGQTGSPGTSGWTTGSTEDLDAQSQNQAAPPGTPEWMFPTHQIPPGAASQERNLKGQIGNLPPENETSVLADLERVYAGMPPGPAKEAMAKAIEEQKARSARAIGATSSAPQATPPSATATSAIGSEFAKWKASRQNEVPR